MVSLPVPPCEVLRLDDDEVDVEYNHRITHPSGLATGKLADISHRWNSATATWP